MAGGGVGRALVGTDGARMTDVTELAGLAGLAGLATDEYVLYQIAKGSSPLRELPFYFLPDSTSVRQSELASLNWLAYKS
ncbi:hypothetical protein PAECIP111891_04794 [Paenibacillus allorhizoplanae]|uniref:Uncharacterized protein n=1 Tax=Paenibacillus allorhizoplanae TaxID=2905648 RepID=A0ABM9CQ92_9BACL|nr:hypothetical protein [Paenibacillus allorhizoplanae]CAH1218804.1 hypothetical protein PAECIP111891_04794 [Paenibacillus allorhizoplanae]